MSPDLADETATSRADQPTGFGKPIAAAILIAGADWLFYAHAPGISVAVFAVALAITAVTVNPVVANRATAFGASGLFALSLLPVIEDCSPISCGLAALGTASFVVAMATLGLGTLRHRISSAILLLMSGPARIPGLLEDASRFDGTRSAPRVSAEALSVWVLPVVLSGVFAALFVSANPVLETWTNVFDVRWMLVQLSLARMLFWAAAGVFALGFVAVRLSAIMVAVPPLNLPLSDARGMFGDGAILRCLVLFNGVFAVQTAMDIGYLWGGLSLPDGMSYATYAHRGAYPLMATAVMAGVFVLATMRPGSSAMESRLMRMLVLVWIGQTIALVVSSILRLDLYVAVYSLTELRVAAFVWMGLVAAGLALLIGQIALRRSNGWLIDANLLTLLLALYMCCFVNFSRLIADFNISHDRTGSAGCAVVDMSYLARLGPEIIPSLDAIKSRPGDACQWAPSSHYRRDLAAVHHARMSDWRAWSYRGWRLQRYLAEHAE